MGREVAVLEGRHLEEEVPVDAEVELEAERRWELAQDLVLVRAGKVVELGDLPPQLSRDLLHLRPYRYMPLHTVTCAGIFFTCGHAAARRRLRMHAPASSRGLQKRRHRPSGGFRRFHLQVLVDELALLPLCVRGGGELGERRREGADDVGVDEEADEDDHEREEDLRHRVRDGHL